ncbi:MAG: hypothetical protein GY953_47100 [bacterium]|nr:hypothetical protein [bacterium]
MTICSLSFAQDRKRLRPVPKGDLNMKTGPAVGERIPHFEAVDQDGKRQTFDTLKGENGLVLMFVRSADW